MGIRMIDISEKDASLRTAIASLEIVTAPGVLEKIKDAKLPKGDCLEAARLSGILAAKNTPSLIPLCHPLVLTHAALDFKFSKASLTVTATIRAHYATGVEMEALTACAIAALTIYDMAKTETKDIVITGLRLLKKTGGKSGDWKAKGT